MSFCTLYLLATCMSLVLNEHMYRLCTQQVILDSKTPMNINCTQCNNLFAITINPYTRALLRNSLALPLLTL